MDWADELAASVSGPQVVNDSKTPSGTVHVGSLRGPVILDVIARALRAHGIPTEFLYGVDDLDPMDAQALLTPDAVEHEMGRPLAHVPDQAGDGHASYARHHAQDVHRHLRRPGHPARPLLLDERDLPDGRARPVHPAGARPGRSGPRDLPPGGQRPAPGRVAPAQRHLPDLRQGRDDDRDRWDGERVFYECRPNLVTWAHGCGASGWISPFGGTRQAALEPRVGGPVEPLRGHDRAVRQGPVDRRRVARPLGRDRPRGLRARAAAQRPYEFLNIGGRKMSTSKGRGAAAHQIVEVVPPEQLRLLFLRPRPQTAIEFDPEGTDAIPRLFDEFDRLAAATAGTRGPGQPAAVARVGLPLLAPGPGRRRRAGGGGLPAELQPRRHARPGPAGRAGHVRRREGIAAQRARARDRRRADRRGPPLARRPTLRRRPGSSSGATRCRPRPPSSTPTSARYLAALADAVEAEPTGRGRRLAGADLRGRRGTRRWPTGAPSTAIYLAFLGRPNGPRAGWLLAGLEPGFVRRPAARGRPAAGDGGDRDERRTAAAARRRGDDPPGGDRQGRGPDLVDAGARRRRPAPGAARRGRPAQGRAQPCLEVRRRGGPRRRRPERAARWPRSRPNRPRAGERIAAIDAELADRRGRARRPPPADPEPGRPRRAGRRRGGQRHRPRVGRAAAPDPAAPRRGRRRRGAGRRDLGAPAALGGRRAARDPRPRARREDRRLGLPGLPRARLDRSSGR